jgi:septal ring factor EnvC (AmiA/AmiB activator)
LNPKIEKLRKEHSKNKAKISNLQARNREMEKQIRELENTEIIGLVRARGMSPEDLAELMRGLKEPTVTSDETEDSEYEET